MRRHDFLKAMAAAAAGALVACDSDDGNGGDNTGGDNTGGDNTGGDNTGGNNTGGDNTGGDNTGGSGGTAAGGSGGSTPMCGSDIDAQITCRHDHSMIVTAADIAAGVDKTYDIQGGSNTHGHDVVVTEAMFAQLKAGMTVEIAVPSQIQPHKVYLSCDPAVDPHALDNMQCN